MNIAARPELSSPALAENPAELRGGENHGVVITRIRRQGQEMSPIGSMISGYRGMHVVVKTG
jgi:hypothetical protein